MRLINACTPQNATYAARLLALPDPGYSYSAWELLPVIEPDAEVIRAFQYLDRALLLYRHTTGRWGYVNIQLPFEAGYDRHRQWTEHTNDALLDLFFRAFLARTEATTLSDLFQTLVTDAELDTGVANDPSVPVRLLNMVLTCAHADAAPVKMLWALDGYPALQRELEAEDIDLITPTLDADCLDHRPPPLAATTTKDG